MHSRGLERSPPHGLLHGLLHLLLAKRTVDLLGNAYGAAGVIEHLFEPIVCRLRNQRLEINELPAILQM